MPTQSLYVNLPINDLAMSTDFFAALGFSFNAKFTSEQASCLVINEHIQVMLLMRPFFAGFTPKPVTDAHTSTPAFMSLSVASRAEVDALVNKALAATGWNTAPLKTTALCTNAGFLTWMAMHGKFSTLTRRSFPSTKGLIGLG